MRGNILQENIKAMNTGYITVILSVECFIRGNIFCPQKTTQTMSIFILLINNNDTLNMNQINLKL
jgi:hypothetical protein